MVGSISNLENKLQIFRQLCLEIAKCSNDIMVLIVTYHYSILGSFFYKFLFPVTHCNGDEVIKSKFIKKLNKKIQAALFWFLTINALKSYEEF